MSLVIRASDWQLIHDAASRHGVDPFLLAAIGTFETGWGTRGDGRPPPLGHSNILGVGSFDRGSVTNWSGLRAQLDEGAATLVHWGVRTRADLAAGKLHVQPDGTDHWASADTAAAGYPWTTGVLAAYDQLAAQEDTVSPADIEAIAQRVAQLVDHKEVVAGQLTLQGTLQHLATLIDRIAAKLGA